MRFPSPAIAFASRGLRICLFVFLCLACHLSLGQTWTALVNQAPSDVNTMLLLPDGTVMAMNADVGNGCYRLTPDIHGSYVNGTWTTLVSMHDTRLYYSSDVLTNGRVFIAGGEYGSGTDSGEIYDPLLNSWTMCAGSGSGFVDMISTLLPNGNVLVAPVQPASYGHTYVYNPATDSWPSSAPLVRGYNQDEASWVKLPDSSVLTIDPYGTSTERFIPSLNEWVNDAAVPVAMYNPTLYELGPFILLANSNVFCVGDDGNTAIYTPSGTTSPGTWVVGPAEPTGYGAPDAPSAMMVNGNVLCILGPQSTYNPPSLVYDYDPVANTLTAVTGPGSFMNNQIPYECRMLDLPDGSVLFAISGTQLYDYQPGGAPLAAGQPTITSITTNYYRSYQLTGTLLNGISQGAAYGDDAQMDSNYPLVRMTNTTSGNVYYARTCNWNNTGVMTGSAPVTTEFIVPQNLPAGAYSVVVVANGNSSAPVSLTFTPDTLQISSLTGFAAIGPTNAGSVAAHSANYVLTNTGASTINWAVGNAPAWLNVSTPNGTLTPGGGSSTVTISLNTAVAATEPVGKYAATVWFTNLTTGAIQGVPFSYQSTPLVVNGGFEYGSSVYWTFLGTDGGSEIGNNAYGSGQSSYVHSGFYGMLLGTNTALGYLSQTIPTVPGQIYNLSFWLDDITSAATNEFIVTWNGSNIFSQNNLGNFAFTNFQFTVKATSGSTVLQFGFLNTRSFFGLDDVTLQVPSIVTITQPPAGITVAPGASATFSVTATTMGTLYYQWEFNGTNIAGATASQYTINNVQLTNAGGYSVLVTNAAGGSTLSAPAFLSVQGPLTNAPGGIVAPAGIVNWWPADGNAIDIIGADNGTPQGTMSYVPGVSGLAFNFDGSTAVISNSAGNLLSSVWTVCLWVNCQYAAQLPAVLLANSTAALVLQQHGTGLGSQQGAHDVGLIVSGVNYAFSPAYIVPTNTWTHLAFVGTSTNTTLYVNGVLQSSLTNNFLLPREYIGATYNSTTSSYADFMLGSLDNIMTFSQALSAAQINAIYAAGNAGLIDAPAITSATLTGSNQITLNLEGQTGKNYAIYSSTNLTNWTFVENLLNPLGTNQFIDNAATNGQKYYWVSQTY